MKTLQLVLIWILLTATQSALAEVDLTCQSNCMNKGYAIDFCTEKCSYGRPSSGGYQPSGALGALQAGEREAINQTKQQLDLIKQLLEIEKMKRELQNQPPTYTTTPSRSCNYSVDCPGDLVCNRFNRCTDPKIENWDGERIAR